MTDCDATNFQISLILQIVTVVLTTVSTIMLGMRCKCRGPCGEINLRPRSSPFTPPDIAARPVAESERRPLIAAAAAASAEVTAAAAEKPESDRSDVILDIADPEK